MVIVPFDRKESQLFIILFLIEKNRREIKKRYDWIAFRLLSMRLLISLLLYSFAVLTSDGTSGFL